MSEFIYANLQRAGASTPYAKNIYTQLSKMDARGLEESTSFKELPRKLVALLDIAGRASQDKVTDIVGGNIRAYTREREGMIDMVLVAKSTSAIVALSLLPLVLFLNLLRGMSTRNGSLAGAIVTKAGTTVREMRAIPPSTTFSSPFQIIKAVLFATLTTVFAMGIIPLFASNQYLFTISQISVATQYLLMLWVGLIACQICCIVTVFALRAQAVLGSVISRKVLRGSRISIVTNGTGEHGWLSMRNVLIMLIFLRTFLATRFKAALTSTGIKVFTCCWFRLPASWTSFHPSISTKFSWRMGCSVSSLITFFAFAIHTIEMLLACMKVLCRCGLHFPTGVAAFARGRIIGHCLTPSVSPCGVLLPKSQGRSLVGKVHEARLGNISILPFFLSQQKAEMEVIS